MAAVVIVGEAAALVGAALRQSPAHAGAADLFAFPAIRSRLTFTTERAFARSLTLAVGIVARSPMPQLARSTNHSVSSDIFMPRRSLSVR